MDFVLTAGRGAVADEKECFSRIAFSCRRGREKRAIQLEWMCRRAGCMCVRVRGES